MKDLKGLDPEKEVTVKHGPKHIPDKPKYLRASKDLERLINKGEAFGYKLYHRTQTTEVYEVLVYIGPVSGSKKHPGIYCGFRIQYSISGKGLIPLAGTCFCYWDGLDETPKIKSLSGAKKYVAIEFPYEYIMIP